MSKKSPSNKLPLSVWLSRFDEVHEGKYGYGEFDVPNGKTKGKIWCKKHQKFFLQSPHKHYFRKQGCPTCGIESHYLGEEYFLTKSKEVHGDKYDLSNFVFVNMETMGEIRCTDCNYIFRRSPSRHIACGDVACRGCIGNAPCNNESIIKKIEAEHGIGTFVFDRVEYKNAQTKIWLGCPKHPEIDGGINWFQVKPNNTLNGQGCRKCNSSISKGEIAVAAILSRLGISYMEEYKFADCKDAYQLPFDFYLPDFNAIIEFDGIQHFKPTSFGKTTNEVKLDMFEYVKRHDLIKNTYCSNKNIPILRIPYTEINNIDKLVSDFIGSLKEVINATT